MENRPYILRGSCSRERGDLFSGPMRHAATDSGQATERPSDLFNAKLMSERFSSSFAHDQK